jgi:hypothetical protein
LVPQPPQRALSVRVFTSQPLLASPSQSAKPAAHAPMAHAPDAHMALALGSAHVRPQAPQLVALAVRSVSQPLAAAPSQSPKPPVQRTMAQAPAAQPLAATLGSAQTVSQPPQ